MTDSNDDKGGEQDLVEDPFVPGAKVRRWAAKLHPTERMAAAALRRFKAMASK